ncbi:MAG TPA: FGGY family carbohydrate kinase [Candidatus Cybelea sp.]|nr:FGGY family carbohydrate kinase [Candidatus Cybelea sp.]
MTEPVVIAIDQGTTGSSFHVLGADGSFSSAGTAGHKQFYPQPGWVEHDAEELVGNVAALVAQAKRQHGTAIRGIGIANQGETVVAWDAKTKRPIHRAIVWQDARTHDRIEALKAAGNEETTLARAGLPLDPYFSAAKLRWILENVPEAESLRREKRLRLGTSDAFFLDRLAGTFATDVTTASRTSLMNLETLQWDEGLADLFGVPIECLPQIRPTTGDFGAIDGLAVTASMVDQQAALFGHGCRKPGDAKITFGTGAFALAIAGDKPLKDAKSGLLPTVAWKLGAAPVTYAIDGGVYNAASALNWARELGLFQDFAEIDSFEGAPAIERGLVFVPALSGLGCPYWDRSAAGLWLGMGLETARGDMVQSVLEGVALRATQVIEAMDGLQPIAPRLSIDGGLANNSYFRRFLSRALGRRLTVPASMELTGQGCALFALIGAGLATIDTLPPEQPPQAMIEPDTLLDAAQHRSFADAVDRCRNWRQPRRSG